MLLKSYMILVMIFTFSDIVIFFTVETYIKKSSADDLYAIDSFKKLADKFYNHVLNLHLLTIVKEFKPLDYLHREHHFFTKQIIKIRYNR